MSKYTILVARLKQEIKNIERTVHRAKIQAEKAVASQDDDYYDAAALNLQKFYMGAERIMLEIAREVDAYVPSGSDWHKQLLQQMALENGDIRPALLSERTYQMLEIDYRGFRHVATHLYAFDLKPDRIRELVQKLPDCCEQLINDTQDFCQYLQAIANALNIQETVQTGELDSPTASQVLIGASRLIEHFGTDLPDGSRVFEGDQWHFLLQTGVLTITDKAEEREILRAEGQRIVTFKPQPEDEDKLKRLQNEFTNLPQQRPDVKREHQQRL